jgi:hypothetical protein
LNKNNVTKRQLVHRTVGMAFVPNPNNKPQINHKDGVKSNNIPDNIEWVTPSENIKHSYDVLKRCYPPGLKGAKNPKSKKVCQCKFDGFIVAIFDSINIASAETGIDLSHIAKVCKNKVGFKSAGGFKWKYA